MARLSRQSVSPQQTKTNVKHEDKAAMELSDNNASMQSDEQDKVSAQLWAEQNTPRSSGDKTAKMLNDAILGSTSSRVAQQPVFLSSSPVTQSLASSSSRLAKKLPTEDDRKKSYKYVEQFRRRSDPESSSATSTPRYVPGKLSKPSFQTTEPLTPRRTSAKERSDPYEVPSSPEKPPPSAQKPPVGEVEEVEAEEVEIEEAEAEKAKAEKAKAEKAKDHRDERQDEGREEERHHEGQGEEIGEEKDAEDVPKKTSTRPTRATSRKQQTAPSEGEPARGPAKRKRGRLSKQIAEFPQQEKRRGRPRKSPVVEIPNKRSRESDTAVDVTSAPSPKKAKTTNGTRTNARTTKKISQDVEPSLENGRRSSGRLAKKSTQPRQAQFVEEQQTSPKKQANPQLSIKGRAATQKDREPAVAEESRDTGGDEDEDASLIEADASDENSEDDEVDLAFYGQRARLRAIWTNEHGVRRVRSQRKHNELSYHTNTVKGLLSDCKLFDKFCDVKSSSESSESSEQTREDKVKSQLLEIKKSVDGMDLYNKNDLKHHLLQDVYAFLFPGLLRVLCNVVDFYVELYPRDDHSIPIEPLGAIIDFTTTMIKLQERLEKHHKKVPENLYIVKPVRNGIVAPLKIFKKELDQRKDKQTTKEKNERKRLDDERRYQRMLEKKAREAAACEAENIPKNDWRNLHIARMGLEPNDRLHFHLRCRPLSVLLSSHENTNIDANGVPFDRVDAFDHRREVRTGHGRARLSVDEGPVWSDEQEDALAKVLAEECAEVGEDRRYLIYARVFNRLCRPGCVLRGFTVTDIVSQALDFKKWLWDEEWARTIPEF